MCEMRITAGLALVEKLQVVSRSSESSVDPVYDSISHSV